MHRLIFLALLFFIPFKLLAQIFPKEGSKLNYRLIGFSFPQVQEGECTLEIAGGYYNSPDSFSKNIFRSIACNGNKIIAEVPTFGAVYTWRVAYAGKSKVKAGLNHFSTQASYKVDTATKRLRIINPAKKYKDAYIFIDGMQTLYNMDGQPVWFLPDSSTVPNKLSSAIDMKMSVQKTITFILNDKANEINYDGTILWSAPNTGEVSGDTSEHYHHEFTKLANGHYMIMGNENVLWEVPGYKPDSVAETDIVTDGNGVSRQQLKFATIIEYDEKGKVAWRWKSSEYFKRSMFYKLKTPSGRYRVMDVHENSIFFDERSKMVYMSCRNINKVLKVKYPEGTVIAAYGFAEQTDSFEMMKCLFSGQHSVKISQDGYLYLFDNNTAAFELPKLMVMLETGDEKGDLKVIWEYTCTLTGLTEPEQAYYNSQTERRNLKAARHKKVHYTSGGNVMELPDHSIFASMNGPSSKIFIAGQDKEVIWSAIPEQRQPTDTVWNAAQTYRASIIYDHKDLEQLIWNSEKTTK